MCTCELHLCSSSSSAVDDKSCHSIESIDGASGPEGGQLSRALGSQSTLAFFRLRPVSASSFCITVIVMQKLLFSRDTLSFLPVTAPPWQRLCCCVCLKASDTLQAYIRKVESAPVSSTSHWSDSHRSIEQPLACFVGSD